MKLLKSLALVPVWALAVAGAHAAPKAPPRVAAAIPTQLKRNHLARIARQLSPQGLMAVAAWLAAQPVPRESRAVASLPRPPAISCGSAELSGGRRLP